MIIDESFRTGDLAEAEASARRVYPRAELRDSGGPFTYAHTARGSEGLSFARFKISSRMDIDVHFDNVAAFGIHLGGHYDVHSNGERVDSKQPFLFTPGHGGSHSNHLDVLTINIGTDVLARAAARNLGLDHVRLSFDGHVAISPALRAYWLRTVNYAWNSVIQVPEVFHNEAIRVATFEAVVAAALTSFPITALEASRIPHQIAPSAIRRATAFIDDNADQPLTVAQIAEAARLSVRALQTGFQRELGITPMGYVRDSRLEAARRELRASDGSARVTEVAHRWAFANVGRFAAQYRARFGENPTDTLRA